MLTSGADSPAPLPPNASLRKPAIEFCTSDARSVRAFRNARPQCRQKVSPKAPRVAPWQKLQPAADAKRYPPSVASSIGLLNWREGSGVFGTPPFPYITPPPFPPSADVLASVEAAATASDDDDAAAAALPGAG